MFFKGEGEFGGGGGGASICFPALRLSSPALPQQILALE